MIENNENAADTLLAVTGIAASVSHFATQIQPIISNVAGLIAIISGLFAIRFYFLQTKKIKENDKEN